MLVNPRPLPTPPGCRFRGPIRREAGVCRPFRSPTHRGRGPSAPPRAHPRSRPATCAHVRGTARPRCLPRSGSPPSLPPAAGVANAGPSKIGYTPAPGAGRVCVVTSVRGPVGAQARGLAWRCARSWLRSARPSVIAPRTGRPPSRTVPPSPPGQVARASPPGPEPAPTPPPAQFPPGGCAAAQAKTPLPAPAALPAHARGGPDPDPRPSPRVRGPCAPCPALRGVWWWCARESGAACEARHPGQGPGAVGALRIQARASKRSEQAATAEAGGIGRGASPGGTRPASLPAVLRRGVVVGKSNYPTCQRSMLSWMVEREPGLLARAAPPASRPDKRKPPAVWRCSRRLGRTAHTHRAVTSPVYRGARAQPGSPAGAGPTGSGSSRHGDGRGWPLPPTSSRGAK